MERYGVINIGSNSVKLLVKGDDGYYYRLPITCQTARGQKDGVLSKDAIERTQAAISELIEACRENAATKVFIYATEAVRSASNGSLITDFTESKFNIRTDVIDGTTEAEYSLLGALSRFPDLDALSDVGGGSTEFAFRSGEKFSFAVGAVRLTDMGGEKKKAMDILAPLSAYKGRAKNLVGVGGTFSSLALIIKDLKDYEREKMNGTVITRDTLGKILSCIRNKSAEEIAERYPAMGKARARVLNSGAIIIECALELLSSDEITVCSYDGLDGYLYKHTGI